MRKFDEIVAFAEVEQFIDTPVKRYSSGMYLRLAFAVAAHLEPEILIVDEVLAVGDLAFQKKCLVEWTQTPPARADRLDCKPQPGCRQHRARGRCPRGTKMTEGRAFDVIETTSAAFGGKPALGGDRTDLQGTGAFRFTEAELVTDDGVVIYSPASGQ